MNPYRPENRKNRKPALAPEVLEGRELMTGGVGDTFAIIPATIARPGGQATVSFNLDPKMFTDPGNKPFLLGIDVAPGKGSGALPRIVSVTTPAGKTLPVIHAAFDPSVKKTGASASNTSSSATLVTIPGLIAGKAAGHAKGAGTAAQSFTYRVNIDSTPKSSGGILVGFYLPGNAGGGGVVNQADLNAIKYGIGANANDTTGRYSFDADVNRNGIINQADLLLAEKNFGVGTTVSPVISANLDPASVTDAKNRVTNQPTVHVTGAATPGASVTYSATGVTASTAVADATGKYSIILPLNTGANTFNVIAADGFNQRITGSIASITRI